MSAPFWMPYVSSRRRRRISWSTVSKAALISISVKRANLPDSTADIRSDRTRNSAVFVEWKRHYADWWRWSNLLSSKFADCRLATTFSKSLETNGRLETGREFARSSASGLGLLRIVVTIAFFKATGTSPVEQSYLLNMSIKNEASLGAHLLLAQSLAVVILSSQPNLTIFVDVRVCILSAFPSSDDDHWQTKHHTFEGINLFLS